MPWVMRSEGSPQNNGTEDKRTIDSLILGTIETPRVEGGRARLGDCGHLQIAFDFTGGQAPCLSPSVRQRIVKDGM